MLQLIERERYTSSMQPAEMQLEPALCAVCGLDDCTPIAVGSDFEYGTTNEEFLAVQCRRCKLVYLNPRPDSSSIAQAYPDNYHAFDFDSESFGVVYRIRARLRSCTFHRDATLLVELAKIQRHLPPSSTQLTLANDASGTLTGQ